MKRLFLTLSLLLISIVTFGFLPLSADNTAFSGRTTQRDTSDFDIIYNNWNTFSQYSFVEIGKPLSNPSQPLLISKGDGSLNIPLNLSSGYYGIYIMVKGDSSPFALEIGSDSFNFDLSDELFSRNRSSKFNYEVFGGTFKYGGEESINLVFSQANSKIVDIRFLPLTEEEFNFSKSDSTENKLFYFDNDMFTDFFQGENDSIENFLDNTVVQYDNTDISVLNYCVGTTFMPFYNSAVAGNPFSTFNNYESEVRRGDKTAYEDLTKILDKGTSPIDLVNENKKSFQLFLSYRMNSVLPNDYRGFLNGSVYNNFRKSKQKFNYKMSFYYSDYREYLLQLILEGVERFSPKGITLDFTRTPNFFGYELLDRKKRSAILTDFVRTVREAVPEDTELLVRFPYNYDSYDLNVPLWVKNGYVDYISPSSLKYEEFFQIGDFMKIVENSKVKLIPSITANLDGEDLDKISEISFQNKGLNGINNEYLYVSDFLLRSKYLYDSGASGVLLFNVNTQIGDTDNLPSKLRYLKNPEDINKWFYFEYYSKRKKNCL